MPTGNPSAPSQKYNRFEFVAPLDQSINANRVPCLTEAENVLYRPFNAVSKRPGLGPYGQSGILPGGNPIMSGFRFYAARPKVQRQMLIQAGTAFYLGSDGPGTFTAIGGAIPGNPTPAFFTNVFDQAESQAGGGAADIVVIAFGSGPPRKWDGKTMSILNPSIKNTFSGVENWHDHLWFWGDPNNPDTLYATDLGNPESMAFVQSFGGYSIGEGDGDGQIQRVIGSGDTLYVFKANNIYTMQGYDFSQGEYQFQEKPWVTGLGTTAPHSVQVMRDGSIIFWSGRSFYRLYPGNPQPVNIGIPIARTCAAAALNNQGLMRAVAGDFQIAWILGQVSSTDLADGGPWSTLDSVYMCAMDVGNGVADTIAVFDDQASQLYGKPAWSFITGFTVGSFIPWEGAGDPKTLYVGDGATGLVRQFGAQQTGDYDGTAGDNLLPIATKVTSGRVDYGTPDLVKIMDRYYAEIEANAATFGVVIATNYKTYTTAGFSTAAKAAAPSYIGNAGSSPVGAIEGSPSDSPPGNALIGAAPQTSEQSIIGDIHPNARGKNFTFSLTESSNISAWSLQGMSAHYIEEAYLR